MQSRVSPVVIRHLARCVQLLELLADLLPYALDRLPVPSHRAGALLDLAAGRQCGKGPGDSCEGGWLAPGIGPLGGLDRLPVAEHLLGAVGLDVSEDMGMATHDLGA